MPDSGTPSATNWTHTQLWHTMPSMFRLSGPDRRRIHRLLPIVCPPDAANPELAGPVVDQVERSLASYPPLLRRALLLSLRALSGPRWRRWWAARSVARRSLARGWKTVLALAYYEQPSVTDRLGYDPAGWIRERARVRAARWAEEIEEHDALVLNPAPLLPGRARGGPARLSGTIRGAVGRTERGELTVEADVVVVGSGAGGRVVAAELAEVGLDVLVLEEGGHYRTEEFAPEPGRMMATLYREGGASFAVGKPPVLFAEGRCVGGSTVINGGMTFRTPGRVLDRWAKEEGVEGILPEDVEPYFARVERLISATGQDPDSIGRDQALFRAGAEAKGWKVVENARSQVHCAGCNNCTFGCPTGAKRSVLVSYLPRAVGFGARVEADARVEAILLRGKRAIGVRGRMTASDGEPSIPFVARAKAVFVCGGAIQTPALLLRSGVRSPSGNIGRNLSMHPNTIVTAVFDEAVEGWKGVHQAYQVREFSERGMLFASVNIPPGLVAANMRAYGADMEAAMEAYRRMLTAGVLVDDTSRGRVRAMPGGQALVTYQLNGRDAATIVEGVRLLGELLFAAGARTVVLPFEGAPPASSEAELRSLVGRPVERSEMALFTVHVMGTAAMGGDRVRHVCDSYGRVYDVEGLYVSDASLFPTPIGLNPMETIMALATRNAARFLETGSL